MTTTCWKTKNRGNLNEQITSLLADVPQGLTLLDVQEWLHRLGCGSSLTRIEHEQYLLQLSNPRAS